MKKAVIIILAILPIFLLITISFAGRIIAAVARVPVEKVAFVDEFDEPLSSDCVITVNKGNTYATKVKVYPELASNKKVSYASADESVFTVDGDGVVTGVSFGSAILTVNTKEGDKSASVFIKVSDDYVSNVEILAEDFEMIVGDKTSLSCEVLPLTAINKNVTWQSSDETVLKVNANGEVTALKEGVAQISVTTKDGGFTDQITVTVVAGTLPIDFDFTGAAFIVKENSGYYTTSPSFDLKLYIKVDESLSINSEDIRFEIVSGGSAATLTDGVLSITRAMRPIKIKAYVEGTNYSCELLIALSA